MEILLTGSTRQHLDHKFTNFKQENFILGGQLLALCKLQIVVCEDVKHRFENARVDHLLDFSKVVCDTSIVLKPLDCLCNVRKHCFAES